MTNNIEKLYELAKVKKVGKKLSCSLLDFGVCKNINCSFCDKAQDKNYPPFTEFKQLELIKLLSSDLTGFETYLGMDGKYHMTFGHTKASNISYEQALAELICELWTDLKGEVQEKIRRILQ